MRDHSRILGTLFIAWGIVQAVSAGLAVFLAPPRGGAPPLFLAVFVLIAVVYGWVGLRLREHGAGIRRTSILLSVFALFFFPVGTLVGAYGLWALLGRRGLPAQ